MLANSNSALQNPTQKVCVSCLQIKSIREFYIDRDRYRSDCKECNRLWHRQYRSGNGNHIRELDRKRYRKNPEPKKQSAKSYRGKYPERAKETLKNCYRKNLRNRKKAQKEYVKTHRKIISAIAKRKRAKRFSASPNDLTADQWNWLLEQYGHRCVYCKKKSDDLTQDHIIPLSAGGAHTLTNVVPACRSCNSRKNIGPVLAPIQTVLPFVRI